MFKTIEYNFKDIRYNLLFSLLIGLCITMSVGTFNPQSGELIKDRNLEDNSNSVIDDLEFEDIPSKWKFIFQDNQLEHVNKLSDEEKITTIIQKLKFELGSFGGK